MIFFLWNEWHEARQLDTTYIVKVFFRLTSGKIPNALLCQKTQIRADFIHKRHQSSPRFSYSPTQPSTLPVFLKKDAFRFRHLRTPSSHILGGLGERRTQPIRRHTLRCRHGCSISRHYLEHRRGTVRGICGFTENGWVDWQVSLWFHLMMGACRWSSCGIQTFALPKFLSRTDISDLVHWSAYYGHDAISSTLSRLATTHTILQLGQYIGLGIAISFTLSATPLFISIFVLHPFIFCIPSFSLSVFRFAILVLLLHRPHLFTVMTVVLYTSSPSLSRFFPNLTIHVSRN